MSTRRVTVDLPDNLFRSASRLAETTKKPLSEILQDSLSHTLPPLDDVPSEEAEKLARLSLLDDAALWQVARTNLSPEERTELDTLLSAQNAGELVEGDGERLAALQTVYGLSLVRQSHAWLLLARRGYKVPVQNA